jgi:isopentenyl phosphate kinase
MVHNQPLLIEIAAAASSSQINDVTGGLICQISSISSCSQQQAA